MSTPTVGILHPGQMGVSIAASARNSGATVYWASDGRSQESRTRATEQKLTDVGSLSQLCARSQVVISVCPPHAAEDLAQSVVATGFDGLYLDANAISPQVARRIDGLMQDAGADFVDGSIIGGPAWKPNTTWLYLAGPQAQRAADCFAAGPLETVVMDGDAGAASALKMCFAAYTKGSTALLCAIVGAAENLGIRADLEAQWSRGGSDFAEETQKRVREVTAKAWRFAGEMEEIAATFADAGMPDGFHLAAADIYTRLAGFKDETETPQLAAVLSALGSRVESIGD